MAFIIMSAGFQASQHSKYGMVSGPPPGPPRRRDTIALVALALCVGVGLLILGVERCTY